MLELLSRNNGSWATSNSLYAHLKWYQRDLKNILHYGLEAPRFGEQLYIPTADCVSAMASPRGARKNSGKVMAANWSPILRPLESVPKIKACINHWQYGLSWEDAGAYQHASERIEKKGNADWCTNMDQVVDRYEELDRIFENVRLSGKLSPRRNGNRLIDGILIHIDSAGRPIAGGGWHRFSMALVLNMDWFPAQVGLVHPQSIPKLKQFREPPQ
jgi:hypothetical protein